MGQPTQRCLGDDAAEPPAWRISGPLRLALVAAMVTVLVSGATIAQHALGTDPARPDIVDFNVFHLVGRLVWQRRLAETYASTSLGPLERTLGGGRETYMPYAYPPLFGVVAGALALLPPWAAFAAFMAASVAFFVVVLRWLAGAWFWTALLATGPAILINLLVGQNGLMTAGLTGLGAGLMLMRRDGSAGIVAGALAALKPQVGLALPLLFLLRQNWRALAAAAAAAFALSAAAVVLLDPAIMPPFLGALSDSGHSMAAGRFPLHRLVSIYACALDLGAPAWFAMLLHGLVTLCVLLATAVVERRLSDRRTATGIALLATIFVSPYLYDYDLTILGVGLALALPGLARVVSGHRLGALLSAFAVIQAAGIVQAMVLPTRLSLAGPAMLAGFVAILSLAGRYPSVRVRRGPDRIERDEDVQPAPDARSAA